MSKSPWHFSLLLWKMKLWGKEKNLPCLDNQKIRRKDSSTVYTIMFYVLLSLNAHTWCQHLQGVVNSFHMPKQYFENCWLKKCNSLPFSEWSTKNLHTILLEKIIFDRRNCHGKSIPIQGHMVSFLEIRGKGNKPDTLRSLFPFWIMNLMLPMLTETMLTLY